MFNQNTSSFNRADREILCQIVPQNAHVLDLGCGDGTLLAELMERKKVTGRGIDIDERNIIQCIERGLSVTQSDLDKGLVDYPDNAYDYVILNQTLQVIMKPDHIIREMLRVGKSGIVGFPNFGHWRPRFSLFFDGKMPKIPTLPFEWYNTPNIHLLTIRDFRDFCRRENITIIREEYFIAGSWRHMPFWRPLANLLAVHGMFVIRKSA